MISSAGMNVNIDIMLGGRGCVDKDQEGDFLKVNGRLKFLPFLDIVI